MSYGVVSSTFVIVSINNVFYIHTFTILNKSDSHLDANHIIKILNPNSRTDTMRTFSSHL